MKIAIIGTGVMGRGWIVQCAMTGHEVHCFDANAETLKGAVPYSEKLAGKVAKKFKIDDPEFAAKAVSKPSRMDSPAACRRPAAGRMTATRRGGWKPWR